MDEQRLATRLALVREHVAAENSHNLGAIMTTFGESAHYYDEPWHEDHAGHDGVRSYYGDLLQSVPDLVIDVQREHLTNDNVILEVIVRGTHGGSWRGLPATGRPVTFALCGIFSFDANDRLASERIYYDRATVLRQLGVFYEPQTTLGQLTTALTHPLTILRAGIGRITSLVARKNPHASL